MNEIESANETERLPNAEASDLATEPPEETNDEAVQADGIPSASAAEDAVAPAQAPELPANSLSDFDSAVEAEPHDSKRLDLLQAELNRLKAALAEKDAFYTRVGLECSEFSELFPNTSLSDLPDCVWESVKGGVPVAAAYALEQRRRAVAEARAEQLLQKNRERSTGAVGQPEQEYFSPDEVRAMSQAEVRNHYQKIMLSMQKWK